MIRFLFNYIRISVYIDVLQDYNVLLIKSLLVQIWDSSLKLNYLSTLILKVMIHTFSYITTYIHPHSCTSLYLQDRNIMRGILDICLIVLV